MHRIASFFLIGLTACAPQPEPGDSVPSPADGALEAVSGVVRIVGSAPVNVQVVLQAASGRAFRLTGPLRPELEKLSGIEVTVTGRVSPSPDPMVDRELEATSYEIGMVNGRGVIVGEIVRVARPEATLRTEDGREIYLQSIPTEFTEGQKVWIQGPESVVVQSYGVLRP